MNKFKELMEAIDILVSRKIQNTTQVYFGIIKSIDNNSCVIEIKGNNYNSKYYFSGASVNNYVMYNDEVWRIVSIEEDGGIKIVKDTIVDQQTIANLENETSFWTTNTNNNTNTTNNETQTNKTQTKTGG